MNDSLTEPLPSGRANKTIKPLLDVGLFIAFLASLAIYFNQDFLNDDVLKDEALNLVTLDDLLFKKIFINEGYDAPNLLNFYDVVGNNSPATGQLEKSSVETTSSMEHLTSETRRLIEGHYEKLVVGKGSKDKNIHIYEIVDTDKLNKKISQLLTQADILFEQDKLTTPLFENAFSKYEDILALDPNNELALKGINNIVDRYIHFINVVIAKNEPYKVPILLESAAMVGRKYIDMLPVVHEYSQYLKDDDVFNHLPLEPTSAGLEKTIIKNSKDSVLTQKQRVKKADMQIAATAMRLISEGDIDSARTILKDFIHLSPGNSQSYNVLLQLYLDQDETQYAEQLIYENKESETSILAEKAARLFIARNDHESALSLLESYRPTVENNRDYYYLLAGLHIKNENPFDASEIYRKLLILNKFNAYYWFGLGLSLESLDNDQAVISYSIAKSVAQKQSLINLYFAQNIVISDFKLATDL